MHSSNSLERHVNQALSSCPSELTQLLLLGAMRDSYTGSYLRIGQAEPLSSESNEAMEAMHHALFESVSKFTLVDLAGELREYFAVSGEDEKDLVHLWLDTEPFHQMIPSECPPLARKYFISRVRTALRILAEAPGWQELSPRPQVHAVSLASIAAWSGLADPPPFKM
jgi:hypothetical protein